MMIISKDDCLEEVKKDILEEAFAKEIFPYFIEHEYFRFYKMVRDGQYTGAWYELKDLSEVILKLPVLLGLSYLFCAYAEEKDEETYELTDNILRRMLTRSLSLGEWETILKNLLHSCKIEERLPALSKVIREASVFYEKYKVVEWRNDMIGHGALPFENSAEFKEKICELTRGIDECLEKSVEAYKDIVISEEGEMEASVSGETFGIDKCVFRKVFFFDNFEYSTYNIRILDYLSGKSDHESNQWYRDIFEKNHFEKQIQEYRKADTQRKRWEWQDVMSLQLLNKPRRYQKNKKVMDWLNKCMSREKGVFLLMMDRGMGKTAFVSSINQLMSSANEMRWYVRVYYCSALKYRSMSEFADEFNSLFVMSRTAQKVVVRNPVMQLEWKDGREKTAECLQDIRRYIAEETCNPNIKLLFIIDGIDEIYAQENEKNIFDFIPMREDMTKGAYILLTSRNGDTEALDRYTVSRIQQLKKESLDSVMNFTLQDQKNKAAYADMLKSYLKESLEEVFDKRENIDAVDELVNSQFTKLCEASKYRFVDFRLNVELLKEAVKNHKNPEDIFTGSDSVQDFFKYMEQMMGEKMFHKAGRLLLILATAEVPLTVGDCIFLEEQRENVNVADILAILKIFESFIVCLRGYNTEINNNTVLKIANERYRDAIIKKFQGLMDELAEQWVKYIEDFYQNHFVREREYIINRDYKFPIIYLHAEVYEYVKYAKDNNHNEKLWNRIHQKKFADAIFQYEKFMPARALAVYVGDTDIIKNFDISMSYSCIRILEAMSKNENRDLLAAAYNSYLLHKKDIFRKEWGQGNKDPKALEEKERLLAYCEEGIKITESHPNPSLTTQELRSKLYAIQGIFLREQRDDLAIVEDLFKKSYNITKNILHENISQGCVLYTQAAERMLSVLSDEDDLPAIKVLYREAVETINWMKEQKEAHKYLIVNARGRVEFGILPREAMFYRKVASICRKFDWHPENLSAGDFYEKALSILVRVEKETDIYGKQINTVRDYKKILFREFGGYKKSIGETAAARELYGQAADIAEKLVRNANQSVDQNMIDVSLEYIKMTEEADDKEKHKIFERLKIVEDWMGQSVVQDERQRQLLQEMKEKWIGK